MVKSCTENVEYAAKPIYEFEEIIKNNLVTIKYN